MDLPPPPPQVCRACGAVLTPRGDGEARLCLGCLLDAALVDGDAATLAADPGESPAPIRIEGDAAGVGFAHYQIVTGADGFPVELGRGAMGVTYRALDTTLHCPVALKVINLDLVAHPRARVRFLREARAAAGLRHPHVASVFFFGERPGDGQPFYAMELVEGETLEARVRRVGGLPANTVMEIGAQVADALGAAEARGLTHRDLKPANLMLVAGDAINVKVIDFGLAKAAAEAQAGEAALTRSEEFIGTPAFASPEQFDEGHGLDVRSDFYALGATLWYALTGKVPFAGGTLAEIRDRQRHRELPLAQLRAARTPAPLVELLRRLLSADPAGRPQTARELAAALADCRQPRGAGRGFHAAGGSRRELAAAVFGVILLGAGLFAVLRHRTTAVARQNGLLQRQTLAQQRQLAAVQTQLQAQTQLIALVSARIERSASSTGGGASGRSDPVVAAQGEVAWERGISVETLRRQLEGERADVHLLLTEIDQNLTASQSQTDQWRELKTQALLRLGEGEHAAGHYLAALAPYQQALALADPDKEPLAWCDAAGKLEVVLQELGRYPEAAVLAQRVLNRRTALQGPEHPATLKAFYDQAHLIYRQGNIAEAEALYRRVLEAQERTLGRENSDTLHTVNALTDMLHYRGENAEAEILGRRCLGACERTLGNDDLDTLRSVNSLAIVLYFEGKYAESAALDRRCLEARERLLGPEHPDTIVSLNNLASTLEDQGELAEAETLLRRALAAQERAMGPDHPATLVIIHNLGILLLDKKDYAAAEACNRRALEARERVLGPDHPETLSSLSDLAQCLDAKGDLAAAETLYQQALARVARLLSPQDDIRLDLEHFFSLFREKQGRLPEALALAAQAAEGSKGLPEDGSLRRTYEQHFQELRAKAALAAASPPPGQIRTGTGP